MAFLGERYGGLRGGRVQRDCGLLLWGGGRRVVDPCFFGGAIGHRRRVERGGKSNMEIILSF